MIQSEMLILDEICPFYKNGTAIHEYRHDFFKNIKTSEQAYWLGFIFADGSVTSDDETNSRNVRIKLSEDDLEHLQKWKNIITKSKSIRHIKGFTTIIRTKEIYTKPNAELTVTSKIMVEDLIKLGCIPNKTYNELSIPIIPKEYIPDFIRGYFDGDGTFSAHIYPPNIKNREKTPRLKCYWSICSKMPNILIQMQEYLQSQNIKTTVYHVSRDNMYTLTTASKRECLKIYNLLYKEDCTCLERKWNKFNYYVNTEVTQLIAEYRNAQEVNVNESNNPPKSVEHPSNKDENVR